VLVEAKALILCLEALKITRREKISPSSSLYIAYRKGKYGTSELRMARKILHLYSIYRKTINNILTNIMDTLDLSWEAKKILELLSTSILYGLRFRDIEKLVLDLRRTLGKDWPKELEKHIGLIRFLDKIDRSILFKEHVVENYQEWFVKYVEELLGRVEARRYLGFQDNVNPPIYAVLNKLKKNEEEIIKIAEENNVHLRIDKRLPGIYILEAEDTRRLKKLLDAGLITIQDFSSYYAVRILDPKPQEKILDVCSAPGTKTFLMTLNMKNRGLIVSIDSSWTRIKGQKKRMKFLGVEIAYEIQADARYPLPIQEKFDKVIVDPPCSSTGLIWREPFYRWFIKPRHIRAFAKLQSEILNTSSKYVKDGGLLLYSTCSITIEENEYVVEDFLKMNPEFSLVDIEIEVGSRGLRGLEESRRLYPHRDLCNGFFVTLFRKKD